MCVLAPGALGLLARVAVRAYSYMPNYQGGAEPPSPGYPLLLAGEALPGRLARHAKRGPDPGPGDSARPGLSDRVAKLMIYLCAERGDLRQRGEQVVV